MHPWFIDYARVEQPVRPLVQALNESELVETL